VSGSFILLAFQTASDEVDYSLVHLWPPEVSSNELDRLALAHMSHDLSVVLGLEDFLYQSFRHPKHAFSVKQLVLEFQLFSPVLSVCPLRFLGESSLLFLHFPSYLLVGVILLGLLSYFLFELLLPLPCRERGESA